MLINLNKLDWRPINNTYLFCFAGCANNKNIYITLYPSKTLFRQRACKIIFEMGNIVLRTKIRHIHKQNIHEAIYKLYEKAHDKYTNNDLKRLEQALK